MTERPDASARPAAGPAGPIPNAGVRFPPPLLFAGGLGVAALLEQRWPLGLLPDPPSAPLLVLAYALAVAGLGWMAWALLTFRRAGTAVFPDRPATRVVATGPYARGRNPMYLGMCALYWGVALWMSSGWAVLLFPLVIAMLVRFVIRREERYLASAFGDEYERYRASVGRWLSVRGRT